MSLEVKKSTGRAGFTLVELAISLMVIGLLIGGVLKGQELIENARIVNATRQITGMLTSIQGFIATYGSIPGDMADATSRLSGCTADPCINGDGGNFVGGNAPGTFLTPTMAFLLDSENRAFFVHLARGGYSIGGDLTTPLASAWSGKFGQELPAAEAFSSAGFAAFSWGFSNNYLLLKGNGNPSIDNTSGAGNLAVTGVQADALAKKLTAAGVSLAPTNSGAQHCFSGATWAGVYSSSNRNRVCDLAILFYRKGDL